MSEWKPIETAPVDRPILVCAKDLCRRPAVFCVIKYEGKDINGKEYSGWSVLGCGCQEGGTDFDEPTHWMPLPDPPGAIG